MSYVIGKDREQMTFGTLSDGIEAENPVRFIEAFVDKIDLLQLGFELKKVKDFLRIISKWTKNLYPSKNSWNG
jgi:hypothetical protein